MAFHTGPLYHLKGRSENLENHNKLLDNPRGFTRDRPSMIRVRPEMFGEIHFFSGPVSGPRIEQENIFSEQTSSYSANAVASRPTSHL
jgi:hypothetical protein